jgi:uncharacterized membrane protein YkoI
MRFIFLCCFWFLASFASADELLLPDNITAETQDNSSQTNEFINPRHQFDNTEDKKILPKLSAAEAADIIDKNFSGQIVSVNLQEDGLIYAIKVLNNGHMKTLYVDANNGRISKLSD